MKVLLVEDNPASRKLMRDHLRRVGHEVQEADNVERALQLALAGPLDLIVMDIQLPGTDGLTATRQLRANPGTRRLPVLVVTAHAMPSDTQRILASGCDDFLIKPIAYKDFLEKVQILLDRDAAGAREGGC